MSTILYIYILNNKLLYLYTDNKWVSLSLKSGDLFTDHAVSIHISLLSWYLQAILDGEVWQGCWTGRQGFTCTDKLMITNHIKNMYISRNQAFNTIYQMFSSAEDSELQPSSSLTGLCWNHELLCAFLCLTVSLFSFPFLELHFKLTYNNITKPPGVLLSKFIGWQQCLHSLSTPKTSTQNSLSHFTHSVHHIKTLSC